MKSYIDTNSIKEHKEIITFEEYKDDYDKSLAIRKAILKLEFVNKDDIHIIAVNGEYITYRYFVVDYLPLPTDKRKVSNQMVINFCDTNGLIVYTIPIKKIKDIS